MIRPYDTLRFYPAALGWVAGCALTVLGTIALCRVVDGTAHPSAAFSGLLCLGGGVAWVRFCLPRMLSAYRAPRYRATGWES